MKVEDLEVGETYVRKCVIPPMPKYGKDTQYIAPITVNGKVELLEILPNGRARVAEVRWTWDYENRPDGWTKARYMIDGAKKKPIKVKYEFEMGTRELLRKAI